MQTPMQLIVFFLVYAILHHVIETSHADSGINTSHHKSIRRIPQGYQYIDESYLNYQRFPEDTHAPRHVPDSIEKHTDVKHRLIIRIKDESGPKFKYSAAKRSIPSVSLMNSSFSWISNPKTRNHPILPRVVMKMDSVNINLDKYCDGEFAIKKEQRKLKRKKMFKRKACNAKRHRTVSNLRKNTPFEASAIARIEQLIKEMQPDHTLLAFRNLSTMIIKAFSILPKKVLPILTKLNTSYAETRRAMDMGFIRLTTIMSKFVVKSWNIMRRGLNKKDQLTLNRTIELLQKPFREELDSFVISSRLNLVSIQTELLLGATGGKAQNLLDKQAKVEIELLRVLKKLKNQTIECDLNQRILDLLQLPFLLKNISNAMRIYYSNSRNELSIYGNANDSDKKDSTIKEQYPTLMQIRERMHGMKTELAKHRLNLLNIPKLLLNKTQGSQNQTVYTIMTSLKLAPMDTTHLNHSSNIIRLVKRSNNNLISSGDLVSSETQRTGSFDNINVLKAEVATLVNTIRKEIQNYKIKKFVHYGRIPEEQGSLRAFTWNIHDAFLSNNNSIFEANINKLKENSQLLQHAIHEGSFVDLVKRILVGKKRLSFYQANQVFLDQERNKTKEVFDQMYSVFYGIIQEMNEIYQSAETTNIESMKMVDELCCAVQLGYESITSAYTSIRIQLLAMNIDYDLLMASVVDVLRLLNMIGTYLGKSIIKTLQRKLNIT